MYRIVLMTTLLATTNSLAQELPVPPPGERLVPIPQSGPPPAPQTYVAQRPAIASGSAPDVILQWNEIILGAIRAERTPPPQAARHLALVHAAMYDAVNAIVRTHRPFRVQPRLEGEASLEAAVAIAAHRALIELYPRRARQCDAALDATLERVPDGPAKQRGMALGQQVAEAMLAWRGGDGSRRTVAYTPSNAPELWRPTPPRYRAALLPQWRYVTPFAVPRVDSFLPVAPPSRNTEAFREALREVEALGERNSGTRSADQTVIAWFWNDGGGSVTPPGHWNRIAQTVSRQRRLTPAENARLFALLNISLADAGILCWEGKYRFRYWRPITAIRADSPDTAAERGWESLLETPPFPSYPSGHSTFSGAAATALARFFGTDALRFRIGSEGTPGVTRAYAGFWAAAEEAGRSRIYGGIHYEFDNQEGLRIGRALAESIARRILLPVASGAQTSGDRAVVPYRPISAGLSERPRGSVSSAPAGR